MSDQSPLKMRPSDRPLSKYRVLDYTTAWAGPRMGTYLAEMGAEVIHVESLQYLDTHRGWSKWAAGATGLFPDNDPGRKPWERNSQYNEFNKNKLGITLNLEDPRGIALFKKLASISDVVLDNYKAGTVKKFGVGYDELRKLNPDIICISCPAFGTTGPYANYTAWGNQVAAIAGHGLLLNYEGEDEPEPGSTYGDPIAAITGAFAITAALIHRERTGQGQYIEAPLSDVMPGLLPEPFLDFQFNGRIATPLGNRNPYAEPWDVFPCAGQDSWVVICCETDRDFAVLCGIIGKPGLAKDERFEEFAYRQKNRDILNGIIGDWTRDKNKFEVADTMQAAGIASEAVTTLPDVLVDPQLAARNFFNELTHPEAGTHKHPLNAIRLSAGGPVDYRASPTYGQHNAVVLGELLGVSAAEMAEMERDFVIGDEPLEDEVRRRRGRSGGDA